MSFRLRHFTFTQRNAAHRKIVLSITLICLGFYLLSFQAPENDDNYKRDNSVIYSNEAIPEIGLPMENLKYILLWTKSNVPSYLDENSKFDLMNIKCPKTNCHVTNDEKFFNNDMERFDAIVFNGHNLKQSDLPQQRWARQKYVFLNLKSSSKNPICNEIFDNFFNWTATYKLNSDIPCPFILIRNQNGKVVGPKINMTWTDYEITEDSSEYNRTKVAAWFVSKREAKSEREEFYHKLKSALVPFGLKVDVYGDCGPLNKCNEKLNMEYAFCLAMENSLAEDYVTEELLTAIQHQVVPIVFGGANYSRFLPPGSYLDGRNQTPNEIAILMNRIIKSPALYQQYLKRRQYYYYDLLSEVYLCKKLCDALYDEKMMSKPSMYLEFRKWWNPNFEKACNRSR